MRTLSLLLSLALCWTLAEGALVAHAKGRVESTILAAPERVAGVVFPAGAEVVSLVNEERAHPVSVELTQAADLLGVPMPAGTLIELPGCETPAVADESGAGCISVRLREPAVIGGIHFAADSAVALIAAGERVVQVRGGTLAAVPGLNPLGLAWASQRTWPARAQLSWRLDGTLSTAQQARSRPLLVTAGGRSYYASSVRFDRSGTRPTELHLARPAEVVLDSGEVTRQLAPGAVLTFDEQGAIRTVEHEAPDPSMDGVADILAPARRGALHWRVTECFQRGHVVPCPEATRPE